MKRMQQTSDRSVDSTRNRFRRWCGLLSVAALLAVVWLRLLPALSARQEIRAQMEFLDSHDIDPSAMFYTELEATDSALNRIESFHRQHPNALWIPGGR